MTRTRRHLAPIALTATAAVLILSWARDGMAPDGRVILGLVLAGVGVWMAGGAR